IKFGQLHRLIPPNTPELRRLPQRLDVQIIRMRAGLRQIMRRLHPDQRIRLKAEQLLKANRHVGGQASPPVQQAARSLTSYAHMMSKPGDGQASGLDNLRAEELDGVNAQGKHDNEQ